MIASITPASRTSISVKPASWRTRRAIPVVARPKAATIRPSADMTDSFLPGREAPRRLDTILNVRIGA